MKTLINHNASNIFDALGYSSKEAEEKLKELSEYIVQMLQKSNGFGYSKFAVMMINDCRFSLLGEVNIPFSEYELRLFLTGAMYVELMSKLHCFQVEADGRSLMGII